MQTEKMCPHEKQLTQMCYHPMAVLCESYKESYFYCDREMDGSKLQVMQYNVSVAMEYFPCATIS